MPLALAFMFFVITACLRIGGTIDWSWWVITGPLLIIVGIIVLLLLGSVCCYAAAAVLDRR